MEAPAGASKDSLKKGESFFRELSRQNWGAELRLIMVSDQAGEGASASNPVPSIPGSMTSVADLESGLQLALSTLPQPGAGRVLLFSDGNESRGHVLNAALQARQMGVPVSRM